MSRNIELRTWPEAGWEELVVDGQTVVEKDKLSTRDIIDYFIGLDLRDATFSVSEIEKEVIATTDAADSPEATAVEAAPAEAQTMEKPKRGRPRKTTAKTEGTTRTRKTTENKVESGPVKRGPGRPRKVETEAKTDDKPRARNGRRKPVKEKEANN